MGNAQFPFAFGSILKGLQAEFDLENNYPPNIPHTLEIDTEIEDMLWKKSTISATAPFMSPCLKYLELDLRNCWK